MSDPLSAYGLENEEKSAGSLPAALRDPAGVLRRGRRWGLVALAILTLPIVGLAFLIPLQYEAASTLMLTAKAIPDQFVASTIVQTPSQQFKSIRSQVFTRKSLTAIAEAELAESPSGRTGLGDILRQLQSGIEIEETSIKASPDNESLSIRLMLAGPNPEQAASLVNRVAAALIDEHLRYRAAQSQVTLDFMRREFERSDEALREHQRKLAQFRDRYRGSLPEEQAATLSRLERLETQRGTLLLEVADLRAQRNEVGTSMSAAGAPTPGLREELETELARLLVLYTDNHPQVQSVRRRLASVDEEDADANPLLASKRDSISQRRARLDADIAARLDRLNQYDVESRMLESKLGETPEITEEFRALEREEVILQESYSQNLRKLKSAELSRSMETSQQGAQLVRIEAAAPPTSAKIPRFVFVALALVLAIGLSFAFVVLHELVHPVVIDASHLEDLTGVPLLGTIPPIA